MTLSGGDFETSKREIYQEMLWVCTNMVDDAAYVQLGAEPEGQKNSWRSLCPVKFTLVWFDLFIDMHLISLL